MLASLEWELGNVEAARRSLTLCSRDGFAAVVNSPDFLPAAACLADAAAGAGEPRAVERLYELLAPYAETNPGARADVGGVGADGARRWRCWPRPTTARRTPPRTSPTPCGSRSAWGARRWELRTIGDWLATGVPVPDRAELVNRGLLLARELGLPGVAARIADEAQIITP